MLELYSYTQRVMGTASKHGWCWLCVGRVCIQVVEEGDEGVTKYFALELDAYR